MTVFTHFHIWPLLLGSLAILYGCGFHLRGSYDIPPQMNPTYIQAPQSQALADELKQAFSASNVQVVENSAQAKAVLRLLNEKQDSRVLAVDSRGKVIGYELTYRVDFDVLTAGGETLVPRQSINLTRNQVNPDVEVLGKQQEQAMLYRDMRRDLASRLLERLKTQLR